MSRPVRARIGLPGQLIEVPGTSALSHTPERLTSRRVTLGGRRIVQEASREHRTWEVTLRQGSRAAEVADLVAFASGEWGRGPFLFLSEWAQVTNLLTPRATALDVGQPQPGTMLAGPITLADGKVAGRHIVQSPNTTIRLPWVAGAVEPVPVLGGHPVCASVYIAGGGGSGNLRLRWLDATGADMGGAMSAVYPSRSELHRFDFRRDAPAGASFAILESQVYSTSAPPLITRPAITWTPDLLPWYPGQGAKAVTVEGLSTEVLQAWAGEGGQRAGYSFTVTEVG